MNRSLQCLVLGVLSLTLGCEPRDNSEAAHTIDISAAASLSPVMQAMADAFAMDNDCRIRFNSASSGALANQLLSAPRADIFLSANEKWMDTLDAAGQLLPDSRRIVARNHLVLISSNQFDPGSLTGANILCEAAYKWIAIGAPEFVPAGTYAKQWLETINCRVSGDLWQHVQEKVLRAPDAPAVIGYVRNANDTLGLVYYTDYLMAKEALKMLHRIPTEEMDPIIYSAAVIQTSQQVELAKRFLDFMVSEAGVDIMQSYGFLAPDPLTSDE